MSSKAHVLRRELLAWFARAQRDLPWRRTRDPYAIWLSEVMLQQTRVETVIPYYERFLARFPTVHALAEAPLDDVLAMWSGLGYYRRARMLHAAAAQVAREHGGRLPDRADALREVHGIGRYTAGAIASIAFGEPAPLVDGNVARVLSRLFALDDVASTRGIARVWALAEELVAREDPGAWNQALMELGATVCVPRDPRCLVCPVRAECEARARGIERELPRSKDKRPSPVEHRWALVARAGDDVLLGRRRPELRFGGTWEPPAVEATHAPSRAHAEVARALADVLHVASLAIEPRGRFSHVLTHRRLEIAVYSVTLAKRLRVPAAGAYDAFEWVSKAQIASKGTSTLARKVLGIGEVAPRRKRVHRDGG